MEDQNDNGEGIKTVKVQGPSRSRVKAGKRVSKAPAKARKRRRGQVRDDIHVAAAYFLANYQII